MKRMLLCAAAALLVLAAGCTSALQRGMQGDAYVSTARPAISMKAVGMPLITGGEGTASLNGTGALGGLPVRTWLAVYGKGSARDSLAVVALADAPYGWYWDSDGYRSFSVDKGVEIFNNVGYDACTYIVSGKYDPFAAVAGVPEGATTSWLARSFAARYNFNDTKLVMEYREPLPENFAGLKTLPSGQTEQLRAFEQRAHAAFAVGPLPENLSGIQRSYAKNILWQYMDQRFLGTVSQYDVINAK